MKTIETIATIGEDHILSIRLPNTIPPGDANIVVIIEEKKTDQATPKKEVSSHSVQWGKTGRKTQFEPFTPIKMKGKGPKASEIVEEGREQ